MTLRDRLAAGERLFFDGAMGTMLMAAGLETGEAPDLLCLTRPDAVRAVHEGYFAAGCHITETNTFGANRLKLPGTDIPALVREAVRLAKEAAKPYGGYVALDVGPTGRLLRPLGDLAFEDAVASFAETIRAGRDADCIYAVTMSDLYELKAAVLAAKENCDLPVFATVTLNERGQLLTGADLKTVVALLEGLRVDALGLNCSLGPEQLLGYVQELAEWSSLPIVLNPNAGLPNADGSYDLPPEGFAAGMARLAPYAQLLGGCCGTTPAHIAALKCSTWNIPAPKPADKAFTVVTSGSRSVRLDGRFAVIGERLNPTGKPKLKQALRDGDTALLLSEAVAQQQAGADLLDVNVGLPEIDERAAMLTAVTEIQAVSPLPLQIDSADPDVLETALRVYNGKAMVNSVNGKRESLDRVLPLVAKYGGVVVGLALDEDGIPDTAEGRIAIARRILDAARAYGIRPKDVVIDGLTLAASSGAEAPAVTLETVRRLREELGVRTVLGVSNVSFGLPRRDLLNAAFLTLALGAGLDSAIINPLSGPMMDAVRAYRGLSAQDRDFAEYIATYSAQTEGPSPAAPIATKQLRDFVENGLSADAERETRALLETLPPMELIDREILPALDAVGKGYESGRLFLPQLLRAAEAAQAAFAVLREAMGSRSENVPRKATVVIATVHGDIHDIGKNIAKVLMQNYGYEVVDLGRDVPPDEIAKAAFAHNAAFVGLSALMTTTVKSMEIAIQTLRDAGFGGKIFVSGAVLNEDTAKLIRADAYVKDAMAAMAYMESV